MTPDSFSDGGKFLKAEKAVRHALNLVREGAQIIDIGGESSRPGAKRVSTREEIKRILPVLRTLRKKTTALLSIDTFKYDVASLALDEGVDIVNDICALQNNAKLAKKIAAYKKSVILMHMQGTPRSMQKNPYYKNVTREVATFLEHRAEFAMAYGIRRECISVDPGFGFGKSFDHNLELLASLKQISRLKFVVTVGLSRKSFIGRLTGEDESSRLEGSITAAVLAQAHGAQIFRVHDVAQHKKALLVSAKILETK